MMFWSLIGGMTLLALAFVIVPLAQPGVERRPVLIGGLVVMIPLVAVLAYQQLGTPAAATQAWTAMPSGASGKSMTDMDLGQLADRLAEKLRNQPDNAEGWALLARTYVEIKRHKESLAAFEKATLLLPGDPDLLADYADALAMSNGGKFDRKCAGLVEQALKLDPLHSKSLMLKATMAFHDKDYPAAIAAWEKILTIPGLDTNTASQSAGSIAETKRLMASGK